MFKTCALYTSKTINSLRHLFKRSGMKKSTVCFSSQFANFLTFDINTMNFHGQLLEQGKTIECCQSQDDKYNTRVASATQRTTAEQVPCLTLIIRSDRFMRQQTLNTPQTAPAFYLHHCGDATGHLGRATREAEMKTFDRNISILSGVQKSGDHARSQTLMEHDHGRENFDKLV